MKRAAKSRHQTKTGGKFSPISPPPRRQSPSHGDFVTERGLVFHNDVEDRMHLRIWQLDPRAPMVVLGQIDALRLVHVQSLFRVWRVVRIIVFHRRTSYWSSPAWGAAREIPQS